MGKDRELRRPKYLEGELACGIHGARVPGPSVYGPREVRDTRLFLQMKGHIATKIGCVF